MCRWLAYSGDPIFLDTLIVRPNHSLIDQSLYARQNYVLSEPVRLRFRDRALPTNGDGFGIGWYAERPEPGVYRDIRPAWNDSNLIRIAEQVRSPLFLAHVRAAYGGTISRENCHPFSFGRWLWQYNGEIESFPKVVRDLRFDVDPQLYPLMEGDADTETCFYLALTYGLESDPAGALCRLIDRVEEAMAERRAEGVFRSTGVTTDGETLYAWRYATDDTAKTLYYTDSAAALMDRTGGEIPLPRGAAVIVSEPLELQPGEHWLEVPPSSLLTVRRGGDVTVEPLKVRA